jgi:uncharacterized GH25 family protein
VKPRAAIVLAVAAGCAFGAPAAPVRAHDFWLEPSAYVLEPGEPLALAFREGHGEGLALPRNDGRLRRFELWGPDGALPVPGVDGASPAGVVPELAPGRYVAVYANTPATYELPADRFARFLEEKGLDRIATLRRARGEESLSGRERFYRSVKCLLQVGGDATRDADRRVGLPLELVAQSEPRVGGELAVRLWFRDAPLADALVIAEARDGATEPQTARTDDDGTVRFELDPGGRWILKVVHMEPAPAGADVDWESWWASLAFAVGAE